MASDFDPSTVPQKRVAEARSTLEALASDRRSLAHRIRTPGWYYPLVGLASALIIGSPGAADQRSQSLMVAFGAVGLVLLMSAHQRATGVVISRSAGAASLGAAITIGALLMGLLGVSFSLAATGNSPWIPLCSALAFIVVWIGGRLHDTLFDRELVRGP